MQCKVSSVEEHVLVWPLHGESLACAGLSVGEYADVVAIDAGLDKGLDLLEDVALRAVLHEYAVHEVLVGFLFAVGQL